MKAASFRFATFLIATILAGCAPPSNRLVVATTWSAQASDELQKSHPAWPPIEWIRIKRDDDAARILASGKRVDAIVGGPLFRYRKLLLQGRLAELDLPDKPCWVTVQNPAPLPENLDGPTFSDVDALMQAADWRSAYAKLIRQSESGSTGGREPSPKAAAAIEGGPHPKEAMAFVASLQTSSKLSNAAMRILPRIEPLVADLLGCVLVESQDELSAAMTVLRLENYPKAAMALMTQPPPWPPASITKIKLQPDGESLMNTLAEQIAPDPSLRAWLISSWNRDPGFVDAAVLAQLVEGKLDTEPRFRAWLRTEWTAWARQRYRRVALRASAGDLP